jgi:MFS family permease
LSDPFLIAVAAFIGMLTGMGKDRGAMLVLESAIIPSTVNDAGRTRAFAWYSVLQDVGQALGGLLAGLPELLSSAGVVGETESFRAAVIVYALLCAASVPLYGRLSARTEPFSPAGAPRITAASRSVLWKISALFALDGIGGGLIGSALFSFFFYQQFGVSAAAISVLFLLGRAMSAASHLGAAWLAARIGLVNTMVFTHIPSSLLLVAIPFAGSYWIAAALYLAREGLAEMDVPTRQSYVMAMVRPAERTFAAGVTSLARMCAWAVAPAVAGLAMQAVALATPLFIAAGMKIGYDLLLWG